MVKWRYESLPEYAFPRLRALLGDVPPGADPIDMSIGEPRHPFPAFVGTILSDAQAGYGRYPPPAGTPEFRSACTDWLTRRYHLPPGQIEPELHIMALNGTREGLFAAPQALTGAKTEGGQRPVILIPNPFYQCYAAAALAVGAEPVFLDATPDTGHLPDFWSLPSDLLARTAAVYLCSPANPQGVAADRGYWTSLMELAQRFDFAVLADECYTEIYDKVPPVGILEATAQTNPQMRRILSFHSLSKRSNLPGLRSGFVVGDRALISRLIKLKSYGGAPSPLPVLAAAAKTWQDDAHVEENRRRYRAKIDLAADRLKGRFGFFRPPGGFFLWLEMTETGLTGEEAALELWRGAGLRTLPGAYLARNAGQGNPGADYIRIALVDGEDTIAKALDRLVETF